jgi:hypothetical protein
MQAHTAHATPAYFTHATPSNNTAIKIDFDKSGSEHNIVVVRTLLSVDPVVVADIGLVYALVLVPIHVLVIVLVHV